MRVCDYINTANTLGGEADNDGSDTSATAGASWRAWSEDMSPYELSPGYKGLYRMNPHERRRFDIRRGHVSEELEEVLFRRGIQIAADGSIVQDGDDVYLLDAPFQDRVTNIKYFHGLVRIGVPIAKLNCIDSNGVRYEEDCLAMNMVQLASWGVAVHCITVLQRKWRNRQWRLYVQPELIQLANDTLMQVSSV